MLQILYKMQLLNENISAIFVFKKKMFKIKLHYFKTHVR